MPAIHTSLERFQHDVIEASQQHPVLVDFWAQWCSPCMVIAPVLDQVISALNGAVGLIKLEVDDGENMKLAGHYRVRGFPTIMLFMNGEEVGRFSGARSRSQVMEFLHQHQALSGVTD